MANGWRLLKDLAWERRWAIAVGLAALVAVDFLQLCVPRLIKFAVDDLASARATSISLLWQAAGVLGLALGMACLRLLWRPLLMGFSRQVERGLRQRLFEHLQDMHLGYLVDHSPGELMARSTNDLNNIRMATGIGLVAAMDGLVLGTAALGFMLYISPLLTLLAVLPMPLIVALTRVQSGRLHRRYQEVQEAFGQITEQVREVMSGIGLIKAYALREGQEARLATAGRGYLELNMGLAKLLALFFPLMIFFTNLSLAVVLGAGGWLTVGGSITAGDFVAFAAYLSLLTWPMMALGWVVSLVQRAKASLLRVEEVLSARPQVQDPARPRFIAAGAPLGLEVRGLTFAYPGQAAPALQDVSLLVPDGQTTALVGRVGSAKSTLLALLCRVYDPPAGSVLLAGVDVLELSQAHLRSLVVQVPQEAFLFSATVRANLLLGRPQASEEEMWAALTAAELAGEVRALEQGLDTMLGERAHTLSGGQRQRLALARALILDPPVLVLDDPLSAVDTETEQRILHNLAALRAGRTTLVVSHRLKSVAFAQRIYVLDQGRVVEEGRHQDLMRAGGVYQQLFAEQAILAELEA
ncbi:MAG: ABC transporter ATP-binding protein [Desulfarculus sp.]|nr:ABC transporter ATP-binding protein [Desulfarculus sp.]